LLKTGQKTLVFLIFGDFDEKKKRYSSRGAYYSSILAWCSNINLILLTFWYQVKQYQYDTRLTPSM
jgi:hypothetical protein